MTRILLTLRRHWPLGLTLVVSYLFTIKADYINQTIASSCDHVTLGVLVADSRQQSKTVVRDSVAVSGETRRHPRYRLTTLKPGETECDVWTLKASDKESNYDNLALTLDSFDLQEHSQVILVAETPRKMRVFRSGQKPPASTLPVRFESTSGLGLIWARSRQPGRDVTKPGRREYLSFSYQAVSEAAGERSLYVTTQSQSTDHSDHMPEKKEKAVLASAVIVSVVTATATVISIVRAGVCTRWRYVWKYRKVYKSDRELERNSRQERFELHPVTATSGHHRPDIDENYSSNTNTNDCASGNPSSDSIISHNNNSNTNIRSNRFSNHHMTPRGASMSPRVLLKLEVPGRALYEQRQALTGSGSDAESDAQADISYMAGRHSSPDTLTDGPERVRHVRFQEDVENDYIRDGVDNTHVTPPGDNDQTFSSTILNFPDTGTQLLAPSPSSLFSLQRSQDAQGIPPTASSLTLPLVTSSSGSQIPAASSLARSPSPVPLPSTLEPRIPTPSLQQQDTMTRLSEGVSQSCGRSVADVLLVTATLVPCPTCSLHVDSLAEVYRSRQRPPGVISVDNSPETSPPPPYVYGHTPPPTYSSLFPQ